MAPAVNDVPPATKTSEELESEHFSPYRSDGKLYGFVCIVTGGMQPVGKAIVLELAGKLTLEWVLSTSISLLFI